MKYLIVKVNNKYRILKRGIIFNSYRFIRKITHITKEGFVFSKFIKFDSKKDAKKYIDGYFI